MPQITLNDLSPKGYGLTERVFRLKDNYFKALPEICIERPRWITRFHLDNDLFNKFRISSIDKARVYRYVLDVKETLVSKTLKFVVWYEEMPFK